MSNKQKRKAEKAYELAGEDLKEADDLANAPSKKREARGLRKLAKRRRSKAGRRVARIHIDDLLENSEDY